MEIDPRLNQYKDLMGESWLMKLQPFMLSDKWARIKASINTALIAKVNLTPKTENIFKAFKQTPFHEVRVVLVGQNPYPQQGVATGLAFESGKPHLPESLKYIYDAMEEDVYSGFDLAMDKSHDLKYLCDQGVLLLNTSLTTPVGVTDVNKDWVPFTTEVFKLLNAYNPGLVFCFWGREAQQYAGLISDKSHHKLYCSHPASGWHNGGVWKCSNFSQVNDILTKNNGDIIYWDKHYYELSNNEVPF